MIRKVENAHADIRADSQIADIPERLVPDFLLFPDASAVVDYIDHVISLNIDIFRL